MDFDIVDVQNICRICFNRDKTLNNLFDTGIKDKTLSEQLFDCTSVIVTEGDEMPQRICEECTVQLIAAFQFRLLCQNSDTKLQQFFLNRVDLQNDQCETEIYFVEENLKYDQYPINESESNTVDCNEIPLRFVETFDDSTTKNNYFISDYSLDNISVSVSNIADTECESNIVTSMTIKTLHKDSDISRDELCTSFQPSNKHMIKMKLDLTKNKQKSNALDTENDAISTTTKESSMCKKKQCQICGKMTTGLKLHVLSHLGIKDYKCEYCGKAFVQRIQYQRHLNIHTGNKPFVCSICGKAFADSTSLRCHNITHTKEKKYKCDVCDKSFGYSHTLTAHKRTHTQDRKHICAVCDRPFLTKHGLKKHTRTHTGEKPYKCDFCDKRFSTTGNIQTHRRIHTRERPYKCEICDMSFSYKSVLNTHGKIHKK